MRFLATLIGFVVAVAVVLFAVSNRTPVILELWPLPYQVNLGLYAIVLLSVLLGFLAGLIVAWFMGAERRRELRRRCAQVRDLEQSLARAKETPLPPAAPTVP